MHPSHDVSGKNGGESVRAKTPSGSGSNEAAGGSAGGTAILSEGEQGMPFNHQHPFMAGAA